MTSPSVTDQAARPAVLVVEDEALVRMFAVDVLEDEGYEVLEANDAAQALAVLATRPDIAIVFSDINMPGAMDGVALARAIADRHPGSHVILTSGRPLNQNEALPGKGAFVTKPYTAQQLVRLLGTALA